MIGNIAFAVGTLGVLALLGGLGYALLDFTVYMAQNYTPLGVAAGGIVLMVVAAILDCFDD